MNEIGNIFKLDSRDLKVFPISIVHCLWADTLRDGVETHDLETGMVEDLPIHDQRMTPGSRPYQEIRIFW
jgi:hypothetical protein